VIEVALPAARAVHFAATLLIEGWVLFQFVVGPSVTRRAAKDVFGNLSSRTVGLAWILAMASGTAWWLLLAAQIEGSSIAEALSDGTAWALLTQTQFGWSWIARAIGFLLFAIAFTYANRTGAEHAGLNAVRLAFALTGSLAWSGHGAATPGVLGHVHLAADLSHLMASGMWLGGLLPFAALLLLEPQAAADTTRRFSMLATLSVLILLPTGIINGFAILPSLDALTGTLYGRLLLAKLALFGLMLAFAAVNRFALTPRLASSNSANARSRLIIHSGCEIALGLAILSLVGVLGTLTPMQPTEKHHHAALNYSTVAGGSGGGSIVPGPRSGRSSIAIRQIMPQIATKAQAANT